MKKQTDKEDGIKQSAAQAQDPEIAKIQELAHKAENQKLSYDERNELLEERNDILADLFYKWLLDEGLSEKVSSRHADNADLLLNAYLLQREECNMEQGPSYLGDFFGYFYIRKCMWSTPNNLKSTAASIKKFYKCMEEKGLMPPGTYEDVRTTIKELLPEWMEECESYNDPDGDWDPWKYLPF